MVQKPRGACLVAVHLPQFFIPQTITMTWIYDSSNCRSTLSAMLFHFTVNFIGDHFDLSRGADLILPGMWIVLALLVVAIGGPKRLSRKQDGRDLGGMIQGVQRDVTLPRPGTGSVTSTWGLSRLDSCCVSRIMAE